MKKFWIVYCIVNAGTFKHHENYQDAEESAKRHAASNPNQVYTILEAIATTKQPVPPIDIVKL